MAKFGEQYIEQIKPIGAFLEAQSNVKNLEVEGRLGRIIDDEPFDTNISEEYYIKILELLKGCNEWESESYIETKDYFSNNKRFTENLKTKDVNCMKKRRLKNFNLKCEDGEFDLRISFSIEEPCDVSGFEKVKEKCKRTRTKKRNTYIRKDYKYELTEVITETETAKEIGYEYEVEYNKNQYNDDFDSIINKIVYKLLDASIYCEKGIVDHTTGFKLQLIEEEMV